MASLRKAIKCKAEKEYYYKPRHPISLWNCMDCENELWLALIRKAQAYTGELGIFVWD